MRPSDRRKWPTNFARKITTLRKKRGLSLSQLAIKAGLAKSQLSQIEAGKQTNPTINTILILSVALEVSPADILSLRTDATP